MLRIGGQDPASAGWTSGSPENSEECGIELLWEGGSDCVSSPAGALYVAVRCCGRPLEVENGPESCLAVK